MPPLPPRPASAISRTSGQLAKALIIDTTTGVALPVMYNPAELTLDQGNTFAEVGIPGTNASPSQFVRGKTRTLAMELFFDSYETGEDVRTHTGPVVSLLDRRPQTQAPPVLVFSMGRFQFRCVLAEAGQRFTMFLRDGTPVRCTMTVRFQEYVQINVQMQQGLFLLSPTGSAALAAVGRITGLSSMGDALVHVVVAGDTLSALAQLYLGEPARWREIADANRVDDPIELTPGRSLVIPAAGPGGVAGAPR